MLRGDWILEAVVGNCWSNVSTESIIHSDSACASLSPDLSALRQLKCYWLMEGSERRGNVEEMDQAHGLEATRLSKVAVAKRCQVLGDMI